MTSIVGIFVYFFRPACQGLLTQRENLISVPVVEWQWVFVAVVFFFFNIAYGSGARIHKDINAMANMKKML